MRNQSDFRFQKKIKRIKWIGSNSENSISGGTAAIISIILGIATFIGISYSIENEKSDYNNYVG